MRHQGSGVLLVALLLGGVSSARAQVAARYDLSPPPPPIQLTQLQNPLPTGPATNAQDLKKQLEVLEKQIETQQKMIQVLKDQMQKGGVGQPLDKLEAQTATLEGRAKQAAQRDEELAQGINNIVEHQDAVERYGPVLPAPVKELFLPGGNNETPLSIFGALAFGYTKINGSAGGFNFGEFTPDFLLKLNDSIFLEAEIGIGGDGSVSGGSFVQADFFVNDWLTIIAGRFVAPIGWYNERMNNPWINKLPGDSPGGASPLWLQVLPPLSAMGVQATGAFYLGNSPLKLEYAAYVSNGMNLQTTTPGINDLANLENMTNTWSFNTSHKAVGGRLGLWWPEKGLEAGASAMYNGDYIPGMKDSISLWALDLNYHKGNWDCRAEYGMTLQETANILGTNIRRQGFYAQVAYRPRDSSNRILRNLEFVYRYSYVDFIGIDPNALDLTTFGTLIDVPVTRQQNEFGINYYFYPRMMFQVAYQINDEPGFHLHDNNFMMQLAWGW